MLKIRASRHEKGIKPPFCQDKQKNLTIYKSVFGENSFIDFWKQTKSFFKSEEFDLLGVSQGVNKVLLFH